MVWVILILMMVLLLSSTSSSLPHPQPSSLHIPYLQECCHYQQQSSSSSIISPLFSCINTSLIANAQQVFRHYYSQGGPSLSIAIITYATQDIYEYATYAIAVNGVYAEHHGYVFKVEDPTVSNYEPQDVRWNKIQLLYKAMDPTQGWARDLPYLMWMDADAMVLDLSFRLEALAAMYPSANVIVSAENAGSTTLINTGAILIKNTKWTRNFLHRWWSHADRKLFSDQEQFDMLYKAMENEKEDLARKIAILAPDALNSDPPAMTQQRPENRILHLMGEHTMYRKRAFSMAFQSICNAVVGVQQDAIDRDDKSVFPQLKTVPLPLQLGVTKDALLDWALELYGQEVLDGLEPFRKQAKAGTLDLRATRQFSNSIHHFAHAIVGKAALLNNRQDNISSESSLSLIDNAFLASYPDAASASYDLRRKLWKLLRLNLKNRRMLNQHHVAKYGSMFEDWLETIKVVAEAGNNILQLGSIADRRVVGLETRMLLEELLDACHVQQQPAVKQLLVQLHGQLGLLEIADHRPEVAYESFSKAVNLAETLAEISGSHALITPLAQLGNVLGVLGQFDYAAEVFERALSLASGHVGSNHTSLVQLVVNFGILQVMRERFSEGRELLIRGRVMLEEIRVARILMTSEDLLSARITEYLSTAESHL